MCPPGYPKGRRSMKIAVLILSALVASILEAAAIIAVVIASPHVHAGLLILPTVAVGAFFYGPILFGSMSFYWDFDSSHGSRRYRRTVLAILIGVDVLAVAAIIVFSVIAGSAIWLPIALIVLAALLLVVAPLIGRALRRYDDKHGEGQPIWSPIAPDVIRRKIRRIVITFIVAFVVTLILVSVVSLLLERDKSDPGVIITAIVFAVEFACLSAGLAAAIVSFSMAKAMRAATGRDPSVVRKVAKVVLRGKTIDLSDEEQRAAARYAPAAGVYLPFMLAYIALLYTGLAIQRVYSLLNDKTIDPLFDWGFLVLLIVVLVVFFPLYIQRTRRARRYAEEHADRVIEEPAQPE